MSKTDFQRYPDTVFKSPTDFRVVNDEAEAEAALAEGYKPMPSTQPQTATEQSAEVAMLRDNLTAADELIAKLDEAGAKVAGERDEALKALEEAKAEIVTLKAQLTPPPATDPLDHDGDGKKGGSTPDPEREALKKDLNDLKVPFARNAPIETLRRLLDEATR